MNPNIDPNQFDGRPTFLKDGSPVYKYDPTNFADAGGWEWSKLSKSYYRRK